MLRRLVIPVLAVTVLAWQPGSAHAAARLLVQKTSKSTGGVFLTVRLTPGHQYRLTVGAPKHSVFSGQGGEYYTYVSKQQLFTTTKPFQFKGTTPQSFTVQQKLKGKITGWILYVDVALARGKRVTLRVFDMGH
ncbi:MAG TPA: hypothetical protein VF221_15565 [Chloroflexota bacterium]